MPGDGERKGPATRPLYCVNAALLLCQMSNWDTGRAFADPRDNQMAVRV